MNNVHACTYGPYELAICVERKNSSGQSTRKHILKVFTSSKRKVIGFYRHCKKIKGFIEILIKPMISCVELLHFFDFPGGLEWL